MVFTIAAKWPSQPSNPVKDIYLKSAICVPNVGRLL
jgi:hypothetical protein